MALKQIVLVGSLVFCSCAATFEEARMEARLVGAAAASPERCASLSDRQRDWSAVGVAAGLLAGPTGVAAIPVRDGKAEAILIGAGAGLAAVGVGAKAIAEGAGKQFVQEGCGQ